MSKYTVTIWCSFSVDVTVEATPAEEQQSEEELEELLQQRALDKHEQDGDWTHLAPNGLDREATNVERAQP